jgi:hypothetical protein
VTASSLTVEEASDAYANAMRNPAAPRPGVCPICRTFHAPDYEQCIACSRQPNNLDAFAPITYSVHAGQMHDALRGYKDDPLPEVRRFHAVRLTAILWRFLESHEHCIAAAAGVDRFDLVTTVPSKHVLGARQPPFLYDKVIGLISAAGGTQGLQAINTMEFATRALRAWDVPYVVPVAAAALVFDQDGQVQDPAVEVQLNTLGGEVVRVARRFAAHSPAHRASECDEAAERVAAAA